MSESLVLESCIKVNQSLPSEEKSQSKSFDVMIAEFNNNSISTYSPIPNPLPNSTDFSSLETDFEILKAIEDTASI